MGDAEEIEFKRPDHKRLLLLDIMAQYLRGKYTNVGQYLLDFQGTDPKDVHEAIRKYNTSKKFRREVDENVRDLTDMQNII